MLLNIVHRLVDTLSQSYGIASGRVYREREDDYILIESIGEYGQAIAGKTVPKSYGMIKEIERKRLVLITPTTPGFDPKLESQFTHLDNAAILVGTNPSFILSLGLRHMESEETLLVLLETIRATVGMKLRQTVLEGQLHQAQIIQASLLPRRLPRMEGFELAAVTQPAEEVGGDIYDVQRVDKGILGIAIADASGHGLPAALQARDIVTGLRMGVMKDQKIPATIRRLNQVIHMSGLASRFISLFYAEVDETGNLFYVNCGHCPPLLFRQTGEILELPSSGPVLGPLPHARFRRSHATLGTGDYLVLFTDGVIERDRSSTDSEVLQEFGRDRLIDVCRENLGRSARAMMTAIVKSVREYGQNSPWEDDATVLVVRRQTKNSLQPKVAPGPVRL
jgi:sigma-B regulation protein RsbU (phosphoserine phosphatase)